MFVDVQCGYLSTVLTPVMTTQEAGRKIFLSRVWWCLLLLSVRKSKDDGFGEKRVEETSMLRVFARADVTPSWLLGDKTRPFACGENLHVGEIVGGKNVKECMEKERKAVVKEFVLSFHCVFAQVATPS